MQRDLTIVFHIGAPFTDRDRLIWSLRKDTELLGEHHVMMRRPKLFRSQIAEAVARLEGRAPTPEDQEALLTGMVGGHGIRRLILSDSTYMGNPARMLEGGQFFAAAGRSTASVRGLFPEGPSEFFLCIRNPALMVAEGFKARKDRDFAAFAGNVDLLSLRWSDVIDRIQQANPGCPVTVWCDEDTPIIWPTILSEVTGINPPARFAGGLDIIRPIMSKAGADRLETYLDTRPQFTESQRRSIRSIFLEKFMLEEVAEEEVDFPGLTSDLLDEICDAYDYDQEVIAEMAGVRFLSS